MNKRYDENRIAGVSGLRDSDKNHDNMISLCTERGYSLFFIKMIHVM